jgi:hypothetical protein
MSNELVVKGTDIVGLQAEDSSWISGLENDIMRPKFARLYGHAAAALIPGGEKYIEGLKAGDYAIGSDRVILGPKMRIVVCGTKKDYVELDKDPPDGKFIERHSPANFDQIKSVLTQDEKNPGRWRDSGGHCFVETMTLFFLELGHLELGGLCMSFTSSGIKAWREIISRTASAKVKTDDGKLVPLAPWACVWTLGSKTEQAKIGNPYLLPAVDGNFTILEPQYREMAHAAFDQVQTALESGRVEVKDED